MSTQPDVAVELERLHGTMETGFATAEGRLEVTAQRLVQAEKQVEDLEERVSALERTRWPLPALAALTGVVGVLIALWQAAGHP